MVDFSPAFLLINAVSVFESQDDITLSILSISLIAILICSSAVLAETTIIYAGELLAVPGDKVLSNSTIVIEDKVIKQVLSGYVEAGEIDKDATIIDLKNSFVLPGLMDMHVHLQGELGPDNIKDSLKLSLIHI